MNFDDSLLSTSSRSSDTISSDGKRFQDNLLKYDTKNKIESGEWVVTSKKGKAVTSIAWNKFGEVRDKNTLKYMGFVQCFSCKTIKIFKTSGGPSVLARHTCVQSAASIKKVHVTSDMKRKFRDTCVEISVGDIRPFNMFSGPNFTNLIQKAVDFGAENGKFDAADLISDPTTISRACKTQSDLARQEIMPEVIEMARKGVLSATTDMWTENYNKNHFLTLTAHYINAEWELVSRILFTIKFPEESETAQNIKKVLFDKLEALGISDEVARKIIFVTDNGANIKRALEMSSVYRLYCAAHCLNIILKHTFTLKLCDLNFYSKEGNEVIETVSLTVASVKLLDKTLGKKLKGPPSVVSGRYVSVIPMLETVDANYEQICEVLDLYGHSTLKQRLALIKIRELVIYMKPIEEAAKPFGNNLEHINPLWLQNHIHHNENDSDLLISLKQQTQNELAALESLQLINKCKEIVTLLKRYGVMETFDISLKQAVETRWNSKLIMLQSFSRNFEKVNSVLKEHKKDDLLLSDVEQNKLESLIGYLSVFKEETEKLEAENTPTLQYYLLSYNRLRKHCLPNANDCEGLRNLRQRAYSLLQQKFIPDKVHKIATFLWPQFRNLKMLSDNEKQEVLLEVTEMCKKIESENPLYHPPQRKLKMTMMSGEKMTMEMMKFRRTFMGFLETVQICLAGGAYRNGVFLN